MYVLLMVLIMAMAVLFGLLFALALLAGYPIISLFPGFLFAVCLYLFLNAKKGYETKVLSSASGQPEERPEIDRPSSPDQPTSDVDNATESAAPPFDFGNWDNNSRAIVLVVVLILCWLAARDTSMAIPAPAGQKQLQEKLSSLADDWEKAREENNHIRANDAETAAQDVAEKMRGKRVSAWVGQWVSGDSNSITLKYGIITFILHCPHGDLSRDWILLFDELNQGWQCPVSAKHFQELVRDGGNEDYFEFSGIIQQEGNLFAGNRVSEPEYVILLNKILPVK